MVDAWRSVITGFVVYDKPRDLFMWDKIRVREILPRTTAKKRGKR